jgi:hypothetical protein
MTLHTQPKNRHSRESGNLQNICGIKAFAGITVGVGVYQ